MSGYRSALAENVERPAPNVQRRMKNLLDDLERGALAVTRGRAGQQGANGVNRLAVAADDAADVALAELDAEDRHFSRRNFREHHLVGKLDQLANDEFEELFHGPDFIRG